MSRTVWTTPDIEADLEERTWVYLSQHHSIEYERHTIDATGKISAADIIAIMNGRPASTPLGAETPTTVVTLSKATTSLRFEFATDAEALAFRLTHPDHLIDEPVNPPLQKASRVKRLNRLPARGTADV